MSDRVNKKTTDQLDQCIKILVKRCGYTTENEKKQCQLELLFHATKHSEVKKVGKITDSTEWKQSPLTSYYNMPNSTRQPLRTSTDTSPMEELQQQPP